MYHIIGPQEFDVGYTVLDPGNDPQARTNIEFGIMRLAPHSSVESIEHACERVYVLLEGAGRCVAENVERAVDRTCIFDDLPFGLRVAEGVSCRIESGERGMELAVAKARTTYRAAPTAAMIEPKDFVAGRNLTEPGKGVANGAFHRTVRTMFTDGTLAIGETIARLWSSYPPHHHPQPEIYFYRFDKPQGYAFAEIGGDAVKVGNNHLTRMLGGVDHSQSCAPGYTEYYLWVILNLTGMRYTGPENTAEHEWVIRER